MPSRSKQQAGSRSGASGRKCNQRVVAKKRPEQHFEQLEAPLLRHDVAVNRRCAAEFRKNNKQTMAERTEVAELKKQMEKKVDNLFLRNCNWPMRALWVALKDNATPGTEVPIAIIMDPRCGIERRVEEKELQHKDLSWRHVGETPLLMATRAGRNDVVAAVLAAGADPLATDCDGLNALMKAARTGRLSMLELLAGYGPDISAVCKLGNTALHFASRQGCIKAITLLLQLGANIEARNAQGRTPLFYAAWNMKSNVMETLINSGACIDAVDGDGHTPLHWAAISKNVAAAEALVRERACVTAVRKNIMVYLNRRLPKDAALIVLLTPKTRV